MPSIYQEVLGADFNRLHPKIQERFGFSSEQKVAAIGTGVMDEIWRGRFYTLPFLYIGTWRRIMFPEVGRNIPFKIENYAYKDGLGRETVTWLRTFRSSKVRRFDAYMILSQARGRIIDYLGDHQHLAVDIEMSVAENGGIRLKSGAQRFYEGAIAFPFPMIFSGVAEVCEWFDDKSNRYQISVSVSNPIWGPLFGYRGSFTNETRKIGPEGIPKDVFPKREETRD